MRVGLVAIARPTFDVAFAQETALAATRNLTDAGYEIVGTPDLSMDSGSLAEALEKLTASGIDALIILQASFADSSLAVQASDMAVPVVLWAFPEQRTGGRLRLNSLCGINLAGYALTNMGRDYLWLYRPADAPDAPAEIRGLLEMRQSRPRVAAVRDMAGFSPSVTSAAEMVRERLRSVTIGRVGERPDGFEPCGYESDALGAAFGVTIDEVPLAVLFERAGSANPSEVASDYERAASFLSGIDKVDQGALDRSLRLNVGLRSLIHDRGWSGVATRCWPETFTEFGGAACTPMALLTDDGTPGMCEADVYGNITGLVLGWFGGSASFVADLVHLDRETCTGVFWHCGLAPFSMADPESTPTATIHSNRRKPLLSEFPLKPGRVTLARFSQSRGQHRIVVGGADMIRAPLAFSGTAGVVRFDRSTDQVMSTVMDEGLEHHFGIVYGDVQDELRALACLLAIPIVEI
jgi:L-fucose isomerase-like protein